MIQNVLAVLILTAGASLAADMTPLNLKPGLWEATSVSQMAGMPSIPPDKLASMPPEVRARIQAMSAPTTTTRQSCRTERDLRLFTEDKNKSCKQTVIASTGTKQEMKMECDTSGNNGTGTVTIEAKDSEHVTGTVVMHMASNGRNMDMKVTINAKWISSNCGDVKPDNK